MVSLTSIAGAVDSRSPRVILSGVILLFVPIPPIATILGILIIVAGVALRVFGDS